MVFIGRMEDPRVRAAQPRPRQRPTSFPKGHLANKCDGNIFPETSKK